MEYRNHYSERECAACCPECTGATLHCAHCPQYGRTVAASVEDGCDYSHLVGSPVKHDEAFDAAQFGGLLTDYDRRLLGVGMHISWRSVQGLKFDSAAWPRDD